MARLSGLPRTLRSHPRGVALLLTATCVTWVLSAHTAGQTAGSLPALVGQSARAFSVLGTDLALLRQMDQFVTYGARQGALRLHAATRDPALPTRTVERYEQFYQGVRVWGGDVIRDADRGVPISIFGALAPDLSFSVTPTLTADGAGATFLRLGGSNAALLTTPDLVVALTDAGDYRLAYTAVVSGIDTIVRVFIDAHSGNELFRYSEIQTQEQAVGTGAGVLGDQKKLSTEATAGTYMAFDRHRPPIIQTFDLRGNLPRFKRLLDGVIPYTAADLAQDTDNVWTDVSVVDAHAHVSWTYDYYYKRFGRSGLDGRDGPIDVAVNAVSQLGALTTPDSDQLFVSNAFYCSVCGPNGRGVLFFGSGFPSGYTIGGQQITYLSGALDVAAHELTHAVTDATSRLIYRNESGALNEAFSDIMGKSVEFFFHPAGSAAGQADYTLGKDVVRAAVPGTLNGIRSMANPGLYGDPDHYSRRYLGTDDNGGVHTNSGIANHAFYLAIEGGTHRTSGDTVQGVGASNREQIEKVFYRAFTLLMPSSATFMVARAATIQAARDLYGRGTAPERAVTQAWEAVGVRDPASTTASPAYLLELKAAMVALAGYLQYAMPSACAPAPEAPVAPTRILGLSGNLAFGSAQVGTSVTTVLTISNSGNSTLTWSGLTTGNGVFTASATSGTVAAGGSATVTLTFTPTAATSYSSTLTVTSDATSGTTTSTLSGTGSAAPVAPVSTTGWTSEGTRLTGAEAGLSAAQTFADATVIRLNDGRWRMYVFANTAYGSAISPDGLSFTMEAGFRLPEGSGQSRAIRLDDGRIRMFFSTSSGLNSAVSTDDGTTFTIEAGTRLSSGAAGMSGLTGPGIVRTTGGLYRMYFSDLPIPGEGVKPHQIKSATSRDLLNWTMDGGVRVGAGATVAGNAEHPCAFVNSDGSVTIFYFRNTDFTLYQSTATDGLTFSTEQSTGLGLNDPDIVALSNGTVRLYGGGINSGGGYIASATRATAGAFAFTQSFEAPAGAVNDIETPRAK
ncbi:MAG: M4 family metallopeptidase [Acidobacteria bacterium]|nr:M4 family metallopeptidase [Acidobacteriota bacterium]